MNLKSIAIILVLAAASVCAQAQQSTPAKPTKEDAQKVFKVISGDKAKLQTFCDIAKLGDEMEKANEKRDSKKFEELSLKSARRYRRSTSCARSRGLGSLLMRTSSQTNATAAQPFQLWHP